MNIEAAHYRRSHRSVKIVLVGIVGDVEGDSRMKKWAIYIVFLFLMVVAVICRLHFSICWFSVGQTSLRSYLTVIPIFGFRWRCIIDLNN